MTALPDAATNLDRHQQTLGGNLTALRQVDPALGDRIEQVAVPDHVTPTRGRDGCDTFRLNGPDGQPQWFGRTSMPTVSGPAMLAGFDPGDGNVALPGVGSGYEAVLLCQSLRPFQAVFVLEPDLLNIALALRINDAAEMIRSRRLVLIVDPAWEKLLIDWLVEHDGFAPPARVLSWLWLEPTALADATAALSRAAQTVQRHRGGLLNELAQRVSTHAGRWPLPDQPNVAVITNSPVGSANRLSRDLHVAARSSGWSAQQAMMDNPDSASPLAHTRALVDSSPDLIIGVDQHRQGLPINPGRTTMVTWVTPIASPDASLADNLGPSDVCVATTEATRVRLVEVGIDPNRIVNLPRAASPERYTQFELDDDELASFDCDVALIAEASDPDPEACGLKLTSHVSLWQNLTELIQRNIDTYHDGLLDDLLKQAQRRSGVTLSDEAVRIHLTEMARTLLAPTLQRQAMITALVDAGLRVGLWGPGWKFASQLVDCYRGSVQSDRQRLAIYRGSQMTMIIEPSGQATQELLDAVACGATVMIKTGPPAGQWDKVAGLFDIGSELVGFADRRQLITLTGQLLDDPQRATTFAGAAHQRLIDQHTYAHRLEQLRQWCNTTLSPQH